MKTIKFLFLFLLGTSILFSCSEDDNDLVVLPDQANTFHILQPVSGGSYVLTEETADDIWETFVLESDLPAVAPSEVYVQIDLQGGDFSNAVNLGPFNSEGFEITEGMLNEALVLLEQYEPQLIQAQARIFQQVSDNTYSSEPVTFQVIHWGGQDPTQSPKLWAVGAALPAAGWGWDSPIVLEDANFSGVFTSQPVTMTSVADGNNFRFFTEEGNWGSGLNYPYYEGEGYTIDPNLVNANDGDSNFAFIGEDGEYVIVVDTNAKSITLDSPGAKLWMVGAGVPDAGWGWDSPIVLSETEPGVFEGSTTFDSSGDGNFRFFTEEGNWDSGLNFPHYIGEGYTITSLFENANDGDENFKFTGETAEYMIQVDTNMNRISLARSGGMNLWIVGAGVPEAGWGWDSPIVLTETSDGVFAGITHFDSTGDGNFRFFTEEGNWDSGLNYPHYEGEGYTIDELFENAGDGDSNFLFTGESGDYEIIIDTVNKVIELN